MLHSLMMSPCWLRLSTLLVRLAHQHPLLPPLLLLLPSAGPAPLAEQPADMGKHQDTSIRAIPCAAAMTVRSSKQHSTIVVSVAVVTHVLLLVALHLLEPEELLTLQLIKLTLAAGGQNE
jgi:hypothetical protein